MRRVLIISFLSLLIIGCAKTNQQEAQVLKQTKQASVSQEESEEGSDEMLSSFSLSGYGKGGKKQWDLEGKSADIMTEEIKLTDVTSKVYGKEMDMTITADRGSLNRINNSVHLEKNVRATTDDGATLCTDYLDWDAQNEELTSQAPVHIERGMMEASGTGMVGKPEANFVELKKDVTVTLSLRGADVQAEKQDTARAGALEVLEPTVINCDGPLEVEYQNNLAIFYDNVKVKDSRGEIFADKMDVHFSTESEQSKQIEGLEGMGIEKIVATGDVEIHHGSNITYSQKAVYDTATGKVTLTGQPKLVIYSTEDFAQLMGSPKEEQKE